MHLEAFLICLYFMAGNVTRDNYTKKANNNYYCCSNGKPDYTIKVACMVVLC